MALDAGATRVYGLQARLCLFPYALAVTPMYTIQSYDYGSVAVWREPRRAQSILILSHSAARSLFCDMGWLPATVPTVRTFVGADWLLAIWR